MIQIYFGYGKGKTTSALGQGMRAKGAGKNVLLVQFLKNNKSSELAVLPFDIFKSPEKLPFNPGKEYQAWVDSALSYIKNSTCDIIILDEFLDVIDTFVSLNDSLDILNCLKDKEVIITGHKKIDKLFEKADYITHMEKVKHPYDLGISARKGIEY